MHRHHLEILGVLIVLLGGILLLGWLRHSQAPPAAGPEPPAWPGPPIVPPQPELAGNVEPEPEQHPPGTAYLEIPESVPVGSSVEVPIHVCAGDAGLAAYALHLIWDPQLLSIDRVSDSDDFDPPLTVMLEGAQGSLRINGICVRPTARGDVHVATLWITALQVPAGGVTFIRPGSWGTSGAIVATYAEDGVTAVTEESPRFLPAELRITRR